MLRQALGAAALLAFSLSTDARASVGIQVSWDSLLHDSTAAVIGTPTETRSVWESGRIYSYAHLRVDRPLAGELAAGGDCWVRTMGGVVGKVGQIVDGEAVLGGGQASLVFLHPGPAGAYVVTARGQGQFGLVPSSDPSAPPRLTKSASAGVLMPPAGGAAAPVMAADMIHGRLLDDVARDVAGAWASAHAAHAP